MKTFLRALIVCAAPFAAWPAFAQTAAPVNGPRIVVPAHDIERGETIADSDLVIQTVTPDRIRPDVVMAVADLSGRQARRLLRAGEPVRTEDVRMPVLVAKGSTVTMTFSEPGISLTATGKAMGEGGLGDAIPVENPASFRQVTCIVTGPGEVRAGDATPVASAQLAANP